jgi:hypothetical protein
MSADLFAAEVGPRGIRYRPTTILVRQRSGRTVRNCAAHACIKRSSERRPRQSPQGPPTVQTIVILRPLAPRRPSPARQHCRLRRG